MILESRQQLLKSFTEKKAYVMKWQFKGNVGSKSFPPELFMIILFGYLSSNDEKIGCPYRYHRNLTIAEIFPYLLFYYFSVFCSI